MTARLDFVRSGARTVVRAALQAGPLRILTPDNHGVAAWAYTTTLGGGVVDGDRLHLAIRVGPSARALVSSMGALRVYRSPAGSASITEAAVEEGGLLALLPDPVSCFAGARCEQRLSVSLGEAASLVVADVLTSGRAARGERWAMARWSSVIEVNSSLRDALLLDPAHGALAERMGRFEALATVLLVGPLCAQQADGVRAAIDAEPVRRRAAVLEAVSPVAGGALLRMAGESVQEVVARVRARLGFLAHLLGDDPWARRA